MLHFTQNFFACVIYVTKRLTVSAVLNVLVPARFRIYFNLLAFAVFSLYDFKTDITKPAIAYTSTIITFILLDGVVIYHVTLLIKKDKILEESNLAPVQFVNPGVTHSIIDIPKPEYHPHTLYNIYRQLSMDSHSSDLFEKEKVSY